jgi:hypothetical protein
MLVAIAVGGSKSPSPNQVTPRNVDRSPFARFGAVR